MHVDVFINKNFPVDLHVQVIRTFVKKINKSCMPLSSDNPNLDLVWNWLISFCLIEQLIVTENWFLVVCPCGQLEEVSCKNLLWMYVCQCLPEYLEPYLHGVLRQTKLQELHTGNSSCHLHLQYACGLKMIQWQKNGTNWRRLCTGILPPSWDPFYDCFTECVIWNWHCMHACIFSQCIKYTCVHVHYPHF